MERGLDLGKKSIILRIMTEFEIYRKCSTLSKVKTSYTNDIVD